MNVASASCSITRLKAAWSRSPALNVATTSAFTIERLDRIHALCHTPQRRFYQRPSRTTKQPKQPKQPQQPRIHPRLKPDTFRLFGPNTDTKVERHDHTEQTRRLRILQLLLNDKNAEVHDLFKAYTRLYRLPGGVSLLSPHEMKYLIVKMSSTREASIKPQEALSRIISLLDGAVVALGYYSRSHAATQTDEVKDWYSLLTDPGVSRRMMALITRSLRKPSPHELQDAILLSRNFGQRSGTATPSLALVSYNLLLDIIVRSVSIAPIKQDYYRQDDADMDIDYNPDASAQLEDMMEADHVARQTKRSFGAALNLFTALWSAIRDAGLEYDEFSHMTRIKMECKRASFEVMEDLEAALSAGLGDSVEHGESKTSRRKFRYIGQKTANAYSGLTLTNRGWGRVREAMRQAWRTQQLSPFHINQVIADFSRLRLRVKLRLEQETVPPPQTLWDEHPLLKPFISSAASNHMIQEFYQTIRWNEVQFEMLSLREAEEARKSTRNATGGSSSPSSWFPIFWSRFGTSPAAKEESEPSQARPISHNIQSPVLDLLGIPLPAEYRPNAFTYMSLMRYYGSVEADYDRMMEVVEDYRQSGSDNAQKSTPRPMTLPLLDVVIRPFALHGVPADLGTRWDSRQDREVYEWTLHEDVVPGSSVSKWNVVNLLPFLEEILTLVPARSRRQVSEQEERTLYARLADGLDEVEENLSQSLVRDAAMSGQDNKAIITGGTRAPKPYQVWMWIVALRRVTGDRYNDMVLDWYDRWRAKFGPRDGAHEEEAARREEIERKKETPANMTGPAALSMFLNSADKSLLRHQSLSMYPDHAKTAASDVLHADPRTNRQGWVGWRDSDARVKGMVEFVRRRKEMLG